MTDSEYLLSLLDETFAAVPQIKAHHERMRKIAARLATHPLAAAVLQQEAGEPVVTFGLACESFGQPIDGPAQWFDRFEVFACPPEFANDQEIRNLQPLDATLQPPPPQARVPLTEAQAIAANPYINDPARQALWLAAIRFAEHAHGIHPTEGERSHD